MKSVLIRRCDVVVIGGGIGGLAVAERLAREAHRQGKRLRIILIDSSAVLGLGASGRIEGWFHAGALYSNRRDSGTMLTFVNSLEDLYNWYCWDESFPGRKHCNLSDIRASGRPTYDFDPARANAWFTGELPYILATTQARTHQQVSRRNGNTDTQVPHWSSVRELFFHSDWRSELFSCCRAPGVPLDGYRRSCSTEDTGALGADDLTAAEQLGEMVTRRKDQA